MTNWTNVTNITDLLVQANNYSPFWVGMLLMIFSIFFISFMNYGFTIALIASGFIGFLLGVMLTYLGLVSWHWTLLLFGIMLIGIIYSIWSKRD